MSYENSLAAAQRLADCIRRRGVTVSIELQRDVRGTWDNTGKRGVLSHHTASYERQGATPLLALVKRGRTGVPGPLANGYGGRDFVYRILCMGKANHAGSGGGITLAGFVPVNAGNSYLWGTEYEGGYDPFTPAMREFMAKANAGILDYFGWTIAAHGEHKTYAPTRKIDRLGYTTGSGRDEIASVGYGGGAVTPQPGTPANPWAGKDGNAFFANGSRTLRLYSAGTDVKFVQGQVGAEADGLFGNNTAAKVKAWQAANGLVADAIVGAQTWSKLLGLPTPAPAPRAPDGQLLLVVDGIPGPATYSRFQQVMGTPIDGVVSKPSTLWKAVQGYLNAIVEDQHVRNLTGSSTLAQDGLPGAKTYKVLQFVMWNRYSQTVFGRAAKASDFDGIMGVNSWKLVQYALNNAHAGSARF